MQQSFSLRKISFQQSFERQLQKRLHRETNISKPLGFRIYSKLFTVLRFLSFRDQAIVNWKAS
jgi:hypothetical protein